MSKGLLGILLLSNLLVFAGNDDMIEYLNGSDIAFSNSIHIEDQQNVGFFTSTANSTIKESYVNAVLRYEESLLPLFGVGANTIINKKS
ncbi:MAG: hypothetical protein HRT73_12940 [Flavobacteriales bacterium]|nr:hypothetical protein [Flavobacteriales bacterium]